MITTETEAIVLRTVRINGGKTIADVLTADGCRRQFVVPAGGRGLQRAVLQPMNIVCAEYNAGRSPLPRLRSVRLSQPYTSMHTDDRKLALALFAAEFLSNATRGEQQNVPLYEYIKSSMLWLDACPAAHSLANFHIVLMMRLTRFIGIMPDISGAAPAKIFDMRQACYTDSQPCHPDYLPPAQARLLPLLMRIDFATMHLLRLTRSQRATIVAIITDFYRLHVPAFQPLRSPAVLHELWT